MTLVHVEVRWCTYLILESETITVAGILDCVWPELLRTWVVDVAEHSNVGFGDNVSYWPLSYRIETSPTRDKHAHGIAERSVGNIVTKANVAMLGNINNPCPQQFWPDVYSGEYFRRLYVYNLPLPCDKQRYYLDLAKSRGRIGSIAGQQCLYQLSILCNSDIVT